MMTDRAGGWACSHEWLRWKVHGEWAFDLSKLQDAIGRLMAEVDCEPLRSLFYIEMCQDGFFIEPMEGGKHGQVAEGN